MKGVDTLNKVMTTFETMAIGICFSGCRYVRLKLAVIPCKCETWPFMCILLSNCSISYDASQSSFKFEDENFMNDHAVDCKKFENYMSLENLYVYSNNY